MFTRRTGKKLFLTFRDEVLTSGNEYRKLRIRVTIPK